MIFLCVALTVLLGVAVSAASYFIATNRLLGKLVVRQERQSRRERRRSEGLLDRLIMKHGFSPLAVPVQKSSSSAVVPMPIADPYEAAEAEWEQEDQARLRKVLALDDEEKREIAEAAKARNVH